MSVEHFLNGATPYVRYTNSHRKVWEQPAETAFLEARRRKVIYTQIAHAAPKYVREKSRFIITTRPYGSLAEEVCKPLSDLDILIIFSVLDTQEYIRHVRFWMRTLSEENHDNSDVFCGVPHSPITLDLFYAIFNRSTRQESIVNPFE